VAPARPNPLPLATIVFVLACAAAIVAVDWALFQARGGDVPEARVSDRPVQIASDGYSSSETCKACHPSQYAAWYGSYHRTMTQVATPETVVANFDNVRVTDVNARPMLLERRGRELWADFDEPDWDGKGDAPPRI